MNITITPTKLCGPVTPPPSKSQAHRLIIATALAEGESVISNVAYSQDIEATIRCMEQLGARFVRDGSTLTIRGLGANAMSPLRRLAHPHLDCGESGSTLRFLIPVALAVRGGAVFTGHGRLMERPQKPYFDLFDQKGIFYEQKDGVLTVSGQLTPGEYALPGDVSSQFITGLMYSLPLLNGDSSITLTTPLESGDYVEMTRQALTAAGIRTDGGHIPGRQTYQPIRRAVEADWSQSAFFYAANGLGSNLNIQGLDPNSAQGDKAIAPFYEELCSPSEVVELDVSQCPDLFPALALLAAMREGKATRIVGGARLRIKESDRISAVVDVLTRFGVAVDERPDGIALTGVGSLKGGVTMECHNDHRIAMMAAMAATRADGPVTLEGAQCVAKSFPDFWEVYENLGGIIEKSEG